MAEYVKLSGLEDAKAAIETLSKDMRRKVVRAALKAAAKPIVQAAKANAPMRTGLLKRRIGSFASKIKRGQGGEIGVYIRPRASAKARKTKDRAQDPFYYRFQEAGFHAVGRRRRIGGGRRNRAARLKASGARWIPGKAFLGRAFQAKQKAAIDAFAATIKQRIDLANKRK